MRILHFIPHIPKGDAPYHIRYKWKMVRDMAQYADLHVLTNDVVEALQEPDMAFHKYASIKTLVGGNKRFFDKCLKRVKPDVAHIHTCWNYSAYLFQKACVENMVPVVISVDHLLEEWHVRGNYWLCKRPKAVLYQNWMLSNANALHAIDEGEYGFFFRKKRLNGKVVVVRNPDETGGMEMQNMVSGLISLYKKVADSNPFMLMTEMERKAEDCFVMLGLLGTLPRNMSEDKDKLFDLSEESWRRILLHSYDEGIMGVVCSGCKNAGISIPQIDLNDIDRFERSGFGLLSEEDNLYKAKLEAVSEDGLLSGAELQICKSLLDVLSKMANQTVRRLDFYELCRLLRGMDCNEDLICEKLRVMRVYKKTARLFQILNERYGLGEGFMFMEPLDDKGTKILRHKLFKSQMQ